MAVMEKLLGCPCRQNGVNDKQASQCDMAKRLLFICTEADEGLGTASGEDSFSTDEEDDADPGSDGEFSDWSDCDLLSCSCAWESNNDEDFIVFAYCESPEGEYARLSATPSPECARSPLTSRPSQHGQSLSPIAEITEDECHCVEKQESDQPIVPFSAGEQDGQTRTRRVRFDDNHLVTTHYLVHWSFAHRQARKGLWEQCARDRERFHQHIYRMECTIGPCLKQKLVKGPSVCKPVGEHTDDR